MATIVAVRSGNWSDTSHVTGPWPGSSTPTTKPGVGDTVQTGDYVVTIDEDVHVANLVKNGEGKFYVSAIDGDTLEIVANIDNQYVPPSGPPAAALEVAEIEEKPFNVTGNVSGGSGSGARGLQVASVGRIVGNVSGGSGSGAIGVYSSLAPLGLFTGNVSGGSGSGARGLQVASVGRIVGNVSGGSGSGAIGLVGVITDSLVGNVAAGDGQFAYGIYNETAEATIVDGSLFWNGGTPPIANGRFKLVANPANAITVISSTDAPLTLSNDYPAEADVKSGVDYNRGTMTGELAAGGSIGPVSIVIGGGGIRIS